jgi:GR25 family glycosyltransferase involved in LPS biosynthesis
MNKVSMIYVINLERSPDRKERIINQFQKYNVTKYEFFKAVEPTIEDLNKYPNFSLQKTPNVRRNELGCLLSHINIMKDAIEKKFEHIIIFEDDVKILDSEFITNTEKHMNELNGDFDVLYLGANHKYRAKSKFNHHIYLTNGGSNCTFGYAISERFMKKMIIPCDYKFPIDMHWRKRFINKRYPILFYCIIPHLVNVFDFDSCIQDITNPNKNIKSQQILCSGF